MLREAGAAYAPNEALTQPRHAVFGALVIVKQNGATTDWPQ